MSPTIYRAAVAAAAAIALTASAASAQGAHDRSPRVIATYHFGATNRAIAFPTTIVVADSAGTLVANARMAGEHRMRPLQVSVLDSDLVLQGETRDGTLTLVLGKQAVSDAPRDAEGRWSLGDVEGRLRTRH